METEAVLDRRPQVRAARWTWLALSQSEASNALLEERIAEAMAARAASQSTSPMKGAAAAANPQSPPARPMSAK